MDLPKDRMSVEALAKALLEAAAANEPSSVVLLDATYYVPRDTERAQAEYAAEHIAGAVFFDIDAIAAPGTDLPHMLPSAERFGELVGQLGIGNDTFVVAYDRNGVMSAPRVWWMFKTFGNANVAVLDGGLPAWKAAGLPLTDRPTTVVPRTFHADFQPQWVRSMTQVAENLETQAALVIDARSPERFKGEVAEPRAGLKRGHIPGSMNLPWQSLVNSQTATLRPIDELQAMLRAFDLAPTQPVICSCGSGITACVDAWALYQLGFKDIAVYDGSWAEWGAS